MSDKVKIVGVGDYAQQGATNRYVYNTLLDFVKSSEANRMNECKAPFTNSDRIKTLFFNKFIYLRLYLSDPSDRAV
jgi:hypothetical protein